VKEEPHNNGCVAAGTEIGKEMVGVLQSRRWSPSSSRQSICNTAAPDGEAESEDED
jgi:hypothetical protein